MPTSTWQLSPSAALSTAYRCIGTRCITCPCAPSATYDAFSPSNRLARAPCHVATIGYHHAILAAARCLKNNHLRRGKQVPQTMPPENQSRKTITPKMPPEKQSHRNPKNNPRKNRPEKSIPKTISKTIKNDQNMAQKRKI